MSDTSARPSARERMEHERIARLKREILRLETKGKHPHKLAPLYRELRRLEVRHAAK